MMKYKLLAVALTLIATQTAVAAMSDPFPCPTVRALKDAGVSSIIWHPLGGPSKEWAGIEQSNHFYTSESWTFIISVRGLANKPRNEILASTNAAISNLFLEGGPYPIHDPDFPNNNYYCEYHSNDGSSEFAIAITPTVNLDKPNALKLLKR